MIDRDRVEILFSPVRLGSGWPGPAPSPDFYASGHGEIRAVRLRACSQDSYLIFRLSTFKPSRYVFSLACRSSRPIGPWAAIPVTG
jgi:hypothetical protein